MDEFFQRFDELVAAQPDHPAITDAGLTLSYAGLAAASDAVAFSLTQAGLAPGAMLGYLGEAGLPRLVSLTASLKAGAIFVPMDPREPLPVVRELAQHAQIEAVLIDTDAARDMAEALDVTIIELPQDWHALGDVRRFEPVPMPDDAVAYVRYTSGSTGRPKGIPLSRGYEWHNTRVTAEAFGCRPGDVVTVFSFFWPAKIFGPLSVGASLEYFDFQRRGPAEMVRWLHERSVTWLYTFMSVYRAMADQPDLYFPKLRILSVTGEPLLRADVERFEAMTAPGARITNGYGSSEYTYVTLFFHANGEPITHDTLPLGDLLIPSDVAILDGAGNRVSAGEEGEIVVTSPLLPSGYLNDPERTAEKFRPAAALGGRRAYFTGDRARIDLQGVMHPAGRADEQVKIRGYNVIPSDIEHLLLQIPGIKQAVVVAFEGPGGIRRLACHYVTDGADGPTAAGIKAHLKALLPGYMVPGHYMRHEALPATPSGKIQRQKLPNPLAGMAARDRGVDSAEDDLEKAVAGIWRDILGHGDFGREDDFFDVGGDSLQAMAMLTALEQQFGNRVPLESLILDEATVAALALRCGAGAEEEQQDHLVALNRGGSAAPLFALHVAGGHLSDYLELAHTFGGTRPVIGISPLGFAQGVGPDGTMTGIAAHAARAIGARLGDEPANLLGFSAGGAFAFETARALMAAGAPPPRLIMLDSNCAWIDQLRWVRSAWRAAKSGDTRAGARRLLGRLLVSKGERDAAQNMDEAHIQALLDFQPLPLALARAVLFVAAEGLAGEPEQAEWRRLLGAGLQIEPVPGDHMSMLRGANSAKLAEQIERWLGAEALGRR